MIKTVKDLTLEEIKEYRKCLKKREEKKKEYLFQRYQEALSVAKKTSKLLYNKYHAKKVAIFGSLKDILYFNEWSDIDLAVWGIPPEMYFKAVAEVISLSSKFRIDIVDPKDCNDSLKKLIEKEGINI
ncbi:hypothetical protein ES708_19007 [subsurface metagenome]